MSKPPKPERLPVEIVRRALERVLLSNTFRRSERMRRFLKFTVDQSLSNRTPVKEYAVGLAVYDKPASFDPRIDPIVRVEASRLRTKLREYYEDEGSEDPVVISIRKGGYSAVFRKRRLSRPTSDRQASLSRPHHLYLEGRDYWNKRSPKSLERAMDCFQTAIETDNTYAEAYAGLADCCAAQACFEIGVPSTLWNEAERHALKAEALKPALGEAQAALALKKAVFDWNWNGSEQAFREILDRHPEYATAHHWYGFYCLGPQRRLKAALEEVACASALDPLSPSIATHLGSLLYFCRAFVDATEQLVRAIEIDPTFYMAYAQLGFAQMQLSRFEQARASFQEAHDLGWNEQAFVAALGCLHARSGNREEGEATIQRMNCLSQHSYVSPIGFARVHSGLGETDEAFRFLLQAIGERSTGLIHIKVEPSFDTLKTDHRFIEILKTLDLVD